MSQEIVSNMSENDIQKAHSAKHSFIWVQQISPRYHWDTSSSDYASIVDRYLL